jgi:CheY-like chemotaxis protein
MLTELLNAMMLAELLYDKTVTSMRQLSFAHQRENQKAAIRILHVDDEPDSREVVELSLSLEPDLLTRSCGSGREALAIAEDWKPDLVLLDLIMPQMGGMTTLSRLRSRASSSLPIVFMTAFREAEEIDLELVGAAGVIFKPFDPVTLAGTVRNYLPN